MNSEGIVDTGLNILRLDLGRFDRRFGIGPACWPFFDLLWIHSGSVQIRIGGANLTLQAPDGVLIAPDVAFEGRSQGADASICHFDWTAPDLACPHGFLRPGLVAGANLQTMIRLLHRHAAQNASAEIRKRLLRAILDGFSPPAETDPPSRVDRAWQEATEKLAEIRNLQDVAALAGLSESSFRAEHRTQHGAPAGRHLQRLKLRHAARLLTTTGLTLPDVAAQVGFAHAESLSAAFSRHYGQSPGRYRRAHRHLA